VVNSHAVGTVAANAFVGGLFGAWHGDVLRSSSSAAVLADSYAGGLMGRLDETSSLAGSFASGDVTANILTRTGSLIGQSQMQTSISSTYSSGAVVSKTTGFPFVGENSDQVT